MKKILIFFSFSIISCIIVIPFNTYNPLISQDKLLIEMIKNSSDKDIVNTILKNLIYTDISIGENKQTIPMFIEMGTNDLVIKDILINSNSRRYSYNQYKNSNFSYNDNYLLNNIFQFNYYNSSSSKTYKFINKCYEFILDIALITNFCGNETLYLKQRNNLTKEEIYKPIVFYIIFKEFDNFDHRPGVIGLKMGDNQFISILKKSSEIKTYDWTINYKNFTEEKGEIIFGDLPHLYDKIHYKESNLKSAQIVRNNNEQYSLYFNSYIKYKNNSNYFIGLNEINSFYIEEFFITGTYDYFMFIENNFFQKYINEKLCFKYIYKKANYGDNFFYFICKIKNEKKREEFFNNFPDLIFYQKDINYNFTFDFKDLFTIIPDNERILFNIDFNYNAKRWIFGKPFFKKYQLIFNSDSNLISFYIESNLDKKENIQKKYNFKIIIVIILTIITFIIGIIFGREICSKYNRKIRANELEDNYSYISSNLNNNDKKEINLQNKI